MIDITSHLHPEYAVECHVRHVDESDTCPEYATLTISWHDTQGADQRITLFFDPPFILRQIRQLGKAIIAARDEIEESDGYAYDDRDQT